MAEEKLGTVGLVGFVVKPSTEMTPEPSFLDIVVARSRRQQQNWMNPSCLLLEMGMLMSRSSSKNRNNLQNNDLVVFY